MSSMLSLTVLRLLPHMLTRVRAWMRAAWTRRGQARVQRLDALCASVDVCARSRVDVRRGRRVAARTWCASQLVARVGLCSRTVSGSLLHHKHRTVAACCQCTTSQSTAVCAVAQLLLRPE